MAKRIPITSPQCIELLTLAIRLTPDEYQTRHRWLARITDPEFDMTQLPDLISGVEGQLKASQLPPYPEVGVVFSRTMDGDAPENDPNQMPRSDGYTDMRHTGNRRVRGAVTRNFKFVEIGYQPDWASVKQELAKHGKIPEGQWREAVKKNFRTNGRRMGVADASWDDSRGDAHFPYVRDDGTSSFYWAGSGFLNWLWLVEAE